jgi:hypothetical protein
VLGLAFDPNYAANKFVYIYYLGFRTSPGSQAARLMQFFSVSISFTSSLGSPDLG